MTLTTERFGSVWDALEDAPELAANMRLRSQLMIALSSRIQSWQLSQQAAAARLHISQPRLTDLLNGKIDKFSLDALVNLAIEAGMKITLSVGRPVQA